MKRYVLAISADAQLAAVVTAAQSRAADNLGAARHVVVAPDGTVYVSIQDRGGDRAGIVALRDADGAGRLEMIERAGEKSTTGIALRNGYIYAATAGSVERFKVNGDQLNPGPAEVVVANLPVTIPHQDKGIAFDGKGSLYVSIGAPSNACQPQDRRPKVPGQDPCPLLENSGGIWRFDENKLGQKQSDGRHYATGLRQMPALAFHDGALHTVMDNREQLDFRWPDLFKAEDNQTRPAEVMYKVDENSNIAFHESWNRAPAPQDGYNVTFQPFANGKPSGRFEVFADGFASAQAPRNPNQALHRADGVAQAPDGSLYIAESAKGRLWRVFYRGAGAR